MTIKSFWAAGLTGLTLAAFTGLAAAQGIKLEHDSSAPMKFGSDGAVVDNANCVRTMTGRAEFEQDRSRLRANEARMIQAKDKGRCGEVTRLEARGDVFFITPDRKVRADNAVYENGGKLITFSGRVVSVEGKNVSVADRVECNSDTNTTRMTGNVQTVYYPEQDDAPFQTGDANPRDGRLDRAEFSMALQAKRDTAPKAPAANTAQPKLTPAPATDAATQFGRYDVNRDGFISLDEWKYPPAAAGPAR